MSMKYVAAYLMSSLAGVEQPTESNVETILDSVGASIDSSLVKKLVSEMDGKNIHEVIATGMSKLQNLPTGSISSIGGAVQSSTTTQSQSPPEEKPEEPDEEEEEEDMGFSLFD